MITWNPMSPIDDETNMSVQEARVARTELAGQRTKEQAASRCRWWPGGPRGRDLGGNGATPDRERTTKSAEKIDLVLSGV